MHKKFLFFIILSLFSILTLNSSLAEILPLKKPTLSKEETKKKLLVDILKPLPKPIKKTKIKAKEEIIVKKRKN